MRADAERSARSDTHSSTPGKHKQPSMTRRASILFPSPPPLCLPSFFEIVYFLLFNFQPDKTFRRPPILSRRLERAFSILQSTSGHFSNSLNNSLQRKNQSLTMQIYANPTVMNLSFDINSATLTIGKSVTTIGRRVSDWLLDFKNPERSFERISEE